MTITQEMIGIVMMVAGAYWIFHTILTGTHNTVSAVIFKVIPTLMAFILLFFGISLYFNTISL